MECPCRRPPHRPPSRRCTLARGFRLCHLPWPPAFDVDKTNRYREFLVLILVNNTRVHRWSIPEHRSMIRAVIDKHRIGLRVRALRLERGLTQEDMAERIERSVDTVSNLERGSGSLSLKTLCLVA